MRPRQKISNFLSSFDEHTLHSSLLKLSFFLICLLLISGLVFVSIASGQETNFVEPKEVRGKVEHFYSIPEPVLGVLKDSIVGISASWPVIKVDGDVGGNHNESTGLVVAEKIILTSLHILPNIVDPDFLQRSVKLHVYDGQNLFVGQLLGLDFDNDLILIGVVPSRAAGFNKRPAVLASIQNKSEVLKHADYFYAFRFIPSGQDLFFPIKIGPYWGDANIVGDQLTSVSFGFLGGFAGKGFSGGPILGGDGKTYGLISRTAGPYVYVSRLEVMLDFIKSILVEIEKEKQNKNQELPK